MDKLTKPKLWNCFLRQHGYLLHQQIGAGSFGDVFSVTKATAGTRWAVKRLVARRNIAEDEYIMAEVKAFLELTHAHIVKAEELLTTLTCACIVMELAPMGNLEMVVTSSNVDDVFVDLAFHQVTLAVDYCHARGVAHRDINPSNVLVFSAKRVKLADFGLCTPCYDLATGQPLLCSDYLGQDCYLAPEVKKCQPFAARPADLWSLGCLLYFMYVRAHPPSDFPDLDLLASSAPVPHRKLISALCSVNVSDRPTTSQLIELWLK